MSIHLSANQSEMNVSLSHSLRYHHFVRIPTRLFIFFYWVYDFEQYHQHALGPHELVTRREICEILRTMHYTANNFD